MDSADIRVRNATQSDRQRLANLIHFEAHVHRHLDWKSALDGIDNPPFLIAERGNELLAALACPPDPPGVAWLRLFAASADISPDQAWQLLWAGAQSQMAAMNLRLAYALALQDWFVDLLVRQSSVHVQDVIVLAWDTQTNWQWPAGSRVKVRPMSADDLPQVCEVDSLAFEREWRNSPEALRVALGEASVATVAELDNQVIGYQISTGNPMGGHLARLAVRPANQGQGVGTALVCSLLKAFVARGVYRVTVNTQTNNQASLAIYRKSGFQPTGEVYPVFRLTTLP